ncbi:MAG: hypothetical protein HYY64_02375 [Candidatus Rokubacteria bacterium]|nr:hypothetical protein [Candidatus Rokubacteria bacterium]
MADNALVEASPSSAGEIGWVRAATGLLLGGLSALTLFLAWRSLGWPLIHDAPLMHYVAWRIGEGAVPYRDLFDMNFPAAYLLHAGVLALLGSGDLGFRLFDLAWLGGTCALLGAYARPFGDGASLRPLALAGLALGAGVTLKPHAGLFWLVLAATAAEGARRSGRHWWNAAATVIGFGLLVPAAVALWLWRGGGLPSFLDILTGYVLPLYSGLERASLWRALGGHSYGKEILILVGALAALSLWRAWAGREFDIRRGLLLLGLGYGAVHYGVQGKGWEYHLYPLMGFAAPLATSWLDHLSGEGRRRASATILAGLFLLTVVVGLKGVEAAEPQWIPEKERRVQSLVQDLAGRAEPGGTVQVLDTTDGGVHALFLLRRSQPTRFLYDFHFFHDVGHPYVQALRQEFLSALGRRPPAFLVVSERGWPRGGYERLASFPALSAWIQREYVLERERDGYRIYARRRRP